MTAVFSCLPDEAYLSEINIAGTHDSCTAHCTLENMSRCQSLSVKEQLELGIRLFDIRLYKSGKAFYLCHALADCFTDEAKTTKLSFDRVLDDFRTFLRENPQETLIVSVKQDRGIMNRFFFPAFYDRYIKDNEIEWYLKNEIPTLGDCRGKMVLMRRCKVFPWWKKGESCGLDFSCWPDQSSKRKTGHKVIVLSPGIKDAQLTAFVQDRYSLEPDVKWSKCAKPFLEESVCNKASVYVHFLSTSHRDSGKTLVTTAEKVNSDFMNYKLKEDAAQGWMLFDFPTKELTGKIIDSNFEIYKENLK